MVPLRRIGEALGYQVDWDSETKAATIEDRYIQRATLFDGSAVVVFQGKLQIIDMSREIENALPTVIHDGVVYVPLEIFLKNFLMILSGKIGLSPLHQVPMNFALLKRNHQSLI